VQISSGTLKVVLSSQASGDLVADAVCIAPAGSSQTSSATSAPSTPAQLPGRIITPYLNIPDFGANPTIVSVKSGNWSDPTVWSLGRLPGAGDIVDVNPGTTVVYDVNSTVALNTLEIQATGSLKFRTDIDTQLVVGNFLVLEGGYLEIGTQANPVAANVMAQVFIANQAINTTLDPEQFGTGLIVLGKMTTYGAVKTPYVTLSQEAHAGDTVLHLAAAPSGWRPGDVLELPDTRQVASTGPMGSRYQPQWEQLTIQSISADGLTITLTAPLQYDHLGAHDAQGVLDYLPQVTDVTRNVMVASQDVAAGVPDTRGYTLFTGRADVNVQNTGFCELGRTTATAEDDTTFDSNGNVTHVGTNQGDRTPMTIRDLIGPTSPQADGYQFTFAGNAVNADCVVCTDGTANWATPSNYQWGIVLNNSYYGLIQDNVVYNVAGAGIGVEDGSSSYNRFDGNFVMRVYGTAGGRAQQLAGSAFWFKNPNNYVTNNIATDVNGGATDVYSYGFAIDATYVGTVNVAAFQGADPSVAGQAKQVNMNDTPLLQFSGNELYGASQAGLGLWWIGTFGDSYYADAQVSLVKNFVAWNFSSKGFYGYPTNNVTIDGMVLRGDVSQAYDPYVCTSGIVFVDYMTRNFVIENSDLQGLAYGIQSPPNGVGETLIQNCHLCNRIDITVETPWTVGGAQNIQPHSTVINNVRFDPLPGAALQAIVLSYSDTNGRNLISPDSIYVYAYNGNTSDNFRVYYTQQAPDYVVPMTGQTSTDPARPVLGAPVAGLTNQQLWAQYGLAIGGAVAPDTLTRAGIVNAYVQPL
jgi:hypothetical protein